MKKTSKYLPLILTLVLMFGLSACGAEPKGGKVVLINDEEITLKYTRIYDESDVLDEIIKKYQEKYPNIHISVSKVNLQADETVFDYQQDIIKQIADGAGPDMFMISNNWLPYQKNQIFPMPSGLMTASQYAELFPKVVVNDFVDSDKVYAIPYYLDNLMLYYNTDIFDDNRLRKPPKTWQEVIELIPVLTKFGANGSIQQSALSLGTSMDNIPRAAEILASLMMQYGAEMTTPDHTQATFNLPEPNTSPPNFSAAEALEFYTSFANPSKANYTYTDKKDANDKPLFFDIQAFTEKRSAMFIGYSYHIEQIKKTNPSLRFDTAPMPQLRPENPVVIANYWGETVSKNSPYPNEAWNFIKFVTQSNNLSYYTNATKRVPALKNKLENYAGRQYYGPVVTQVDFSQSWYRKNTLKVEEIFSEMIDNVLHYNTPTTIAIENAARAINILKD